MLFVYYCSVAVKGIEYIENQVNNIHVMYD